MQHENEIYTENSLMMQTKAFDAFGQSIDITVTDSRGLEGKTEERTKITPMGSYDS